MATAIRWHSHRWDGFCTSNCSLMDYSFRMLQNDCDYHWYDDFWHKKCGFGAWGRTRGGAWICCRCGQGIKTSPENRNLLPVNTNRIFSRIRQVHPAAPNLHCHPYVGGSCNHGAVVTTKAKVMPKGPGDLKSETNGNSKATKPDQLVPTTMPVLSSTGCCFYWHLSAYVRIFCRHDEMLGIGMP